MALKGAVARRYAEAVFDLGRESDSIERWRVDVAFLADLFADRRLRFILSEPKVPFATKRQIVEDLAARAIQPQALGLALVLVDGNLIELMPRVAVEFDRLYDDYRHLAKASITTAVPVDASEEARLIAFLGDLTGKNITLEKFVDPAILGGVIARVGDTLIDGSVRHRLNVLRERIISGAGDPAALV